MTQAGCANRTVDTSRVTGVGRRGNWRGRGDAGGMNRRKE